MHKSAFILSAVFALLALFSQAGQASSITHDVKSFTEMQQYVDKIADPKHTLVVMDDDDTLTMMSCPDSKQLDTCQYLGGPAWFSWQQSQIKNMAQPRVADSFSGLLTASSMLFSINYMPYTATDVPTVLNKLTTSGVRLLVETARGNDNVSATERQFSRLDNKSYNKQYPNLLSLVSENSLRFEKGPGKVSPYPPCGDQHMQPISYQLGAMYLSGQNKGKILKCMLDDYNHDHKADAVTHVVFIDDTDANVVDVHKAFENDKLYDVYALHYTALKEHKKALTEGKMAAAYQANAMKRWKAIREAMQENLQNPVLP